MKKVAALLVLALSVFALAACGSDSDSDSTSTSAETTAETTEETTGGGSEGGGSVVKIDAVDGTDLAYVQKDATAKAGQVSIEFTNPQSLSHDVDVEDSTGNEVGGTELVAGGSTTATIGNLEAGEYTFFCSVPGHREAGMEGTLTVK